MNELYELPDLDDLDYIADTTTPLMARADGEGVALSFGFDAEWLTALLQRMQADGKIMKGERIDRETWSRVSEVLRKAVDKGYAQADAPSADEAFRDALHHSTDVFAAFKVHRMQHDMAAALTDEKGDLKPFNQWLNDVQPIASHQVGAWLETEYNTAVIRAHQAADWQQFEAEKDVLPNLRWNPSTSAHPGADHMPFWGVVRPVDDPFWSQHRPGDRWNCKCSLSSTDEPVTALPEGYDTTENAPQPGLKDNPGKTGEIFSPDNNYVREAAPGAKEAVEKLMEREAEIGSNVPAGLNSQEQVAWIKNVHAVEEALNLEQGKPMTHAEANEHRANPNFTKGVRDAYSLNCQSCVVAYELRRRGYDVEARSRDAGGDTATRLAYDAALAWKTIDGESVTVKTVAGMQRGIDRKGNVHTSKRSTKDISKDVGELTKEVGRYSISWTWNEIDKTTGKRSAHIVSAERFENGTIRLYDPQSGEFVSWNRILEELYFNGGIRVLRVDNLVPDENVIKNILLKK